MNFRTYLMEIQVFNKTNPMKKSNMK